MMAWIQNCIFLVTGMAGEIKIKNVGRSALEYPVEFLNGFICNFLIIQFFTHHKFQLN